MSLSIRSWQILTAHVQPFRRARDRAFCLKVPLDSLLVWASREGSGETARMRRLAWTFAARIGYKYQIRLTRSIWNPKRSLKTDLAAYPTEDIFCLILKLNVSRELFCLSAASMCVCLHFILYDRKQTHLPDNNIDFVSCIIRHHTLKTTVLFILQSL